MKKELITCGKYDNIIDFSIESQKKLIRIGSINPNKIKKKEYIPISTNGKIIFYNQKKYKVRDFLSHIDKKILKKLIVLTSYERNLIIDALIDFDCKISVFEIKFPIYDTIKYVSNIQKNYNYLVSLLNDIENFNVKSNTFSTYFTENFRFKIERRLRYKNQYDSYFAFAYKSGYQEIFKLKEERKDKIIISMDFNSMFIDCMMNKFLLPKEITYKTFKNNIDVDNLEEGLYKVILKKPNSNFIKKFHPFKYTRLFNKNLFNLEEHHEVEILLFKNELIYYKNFFDEIVVIEGFFSKYMVDHPLKNYAIKIYEERMKFKSENNQKMANFNKLQLILMHSATNTKKWKKVKFDSLNELKKYLYTEYMIDIDNKFDSTLMKNNFNFKITKNNSRYILTAPNFKANETIYSISSQIIANSNLKMMKTIEAFLDFPTLEICYCNIDSIHVSLDSKLFDKFMSTYKKLFSNKLGDLKIEAIASKGYWFDIGRYWLYNNKNEVVLYKNSIYNHKGNKSIFLRNKIISKIYKSENFKYVSKKYLNIYDSFSYNKKINHEINLETIDFLRYNYDEIKDLYVANKSLDDEILKSKKVKIDLFNKIATV